MKLLGRSDWLKRYREYALRIAYICLLVTGDCMAQWQSGSTGNSQPQVRFLYSTIDMEAKFESLQVSIYQKTAVETHPYRRTVQQMRATQYSQHNPYASSGFPAGYYQPNQQSPGGSNAGSGGFVPSFLQD